MARKGQRAPTRREVTLETIEEHLKEQDKEAQKSIWLTFAAFGVSVVLLGVAVWLGSIPNVTILNYVVLIALGVVLMAAALVQSSKIAARKVSGWELNRIKSKYIPAGGQKGSKDTLSIVIFGILMAILIISAFTFRLNAEYTRPIQIGYVIEVVAGFLALVATYLATEKRCIRGLITPAIFLFLIGKWIQLGLYQQIR